MTSLASHLNHASRPNIRVLIIPGLRNSGSAHWQTWLQSQYKGAVRVEQDDWETPNLLDWSRRIQDTVSRYAPHTHWIAAAHSFGCLALAHHLSRQHQRQTEDGGIKAALLVAPADPIKFQVESHLPHHGLHIPSIMVGSEDDPWMPLERAQQWGQLWGSGFINLGQVGHINTESGFGPWPLARYKVDQLIRHQQRQRRIALAHPMELSYAI